MRILCSFGLVMLMALLTLSCNPPASNSDKAGIAISFDDHFIDEWFVLRPLFQQYGAKVTFFITCPDSLTEDEISKLKRLQEDGHEIGFHGTIHGRSTELIEAFGAKKYAEIELEPGLENMKRAGFTPTSYAHPGGNHNARVDSVLEAYGFVISRDVAIANRVYKGIPLYSLAPKIMRSIYYDFNEKDKQVDALLIDTDAGLTEEQMAEAIQQAKHTNKALMLFGHEPLVGEPRAGAYGFDVAFLNKILMEANQQGLRFYTMSELPQ
jgi:peptidoglycan/xylan/chitin deacetylase (PgdA/CDA1 family)